MENFYRIEQEAFTQKLHADFVQQFNSSTDLAFNFYDIGLGFGFASQGIYAQSASKTLHLSDVFSLPKKLLTGVPTHGS